MKMVVCQGIDQIFYNNEENSVFDCTFLFSSENLP
jgi:hypothetical protein